MKVLPLRKKKTNEILEAGRWAPSWLNRQPWRFIVIRDQGMKERMAEIVPTVYQLGLREAPICIVVCVNTAEDAYHYVEDGAAATQNMALAAHSLGLGSIWIGIHSLTNESNSAERRIKELLGVPRECRLISVLPVGVAKLIPEKTRKNLSEIVFNEKYG